ncbi:UBP1-associated protein 2A-like [Andrographis paniculata]|uniref:UBP1-associated protein 2A-like n=1 Tax=Andrographis paniculata TaxID=175694 RepID=UPI0021E8FE31|nr:UBP1-associated protein 2A-like [Andrographis paniculata]XP_051141828.1 UBP1-associated protein 2A-like [Andrographis paniculata]
MARKRKSRLPAAPQEPEIAQTTEPATEPEPEPEPEPELERQLTQTEETVEGNPEEVGEQMADGEKEEEKRKLGEAEGEAEEEQVENIETAAAEEDSVEVGGAEAEKTEQETAENPSQGTVSENGEKAEEQSAEGEDELEEEPLEKLLEPFSKDQLTLIIKEAVSKHPDVMEAVHKLANADPAHCKIFVHGLGWDANSETITSVFGKYGEIEDCKVVKDKNTGKSKGYGFILYKHRDGARRALKQPQKLINGRMTSCQLASAGPVQTPPQAVAAAPTPHVSEYTQRKIYVSNVSAELDPSKLFEYFSKFGEIEEGPLGLDKQTGKPRGFCLFVYKSGESAKKALEEPHKNFEGHILHCQKAIDGPKHGKNYYNQQPGQPQQQQQQHHGGYYNHPAKKAKYAGSSGGGRGGGHMMAPPAGPPVPSAGLNPSVAPAAIGQAVAALLATQGPGLGIGNLVGGMGVGMNPQGVPPMMPNVGYGGQGGAGGFGGQPPMHGGYGGQMPPGQGGVRPHQGGAPYMGHGR